MVKALHGVGIEEGAAERLHQEAIHGASSFQATLTANNQGAHVASTREENAHELEMREEAAEAAIREGMVARQLERNEQAQVSVEHHRVREEEVATTTEEQARPEDSPDAVTLLMRLRRAERMKPHDRFAFYIELIRMLHSQNDKMRCILHSIITNALPAL